MYETQKRSVTNELELGQTVLIHSEFFERGKLRAISCRLIPEIDWLFGDKGIAPVLFFKVSYDADPCPFIEINGTKGAVWFSHRRPWKRTIAPLRIVLRLWQFARAWRKKYRRLYAARICQAADLPPDVVSHEIVPLLW